MTQTLEEQVAAAEKVFLDLFARGPEQLTWSQIPAQVGDSAPDLELQNSSGETVRLSDFWKEGPALVIFWRHYGCSCGFDRAARLRDEHGDYVGAGAKVVVVGQAEPERSAAYAEEHVIQADVLCDPSYSAYDAYGLREGDVAQILFDAPKEFWAHSREIGADLQEGRRQSGRPLVDNPWLLPAEFVVDRTGTIRLAYRYQYCEDFPDPRVLTTAIEIAQAPDWRQ